jgi:hypothetical protein
LNVSVLFIAAKVRTPVFSSMEKHGKLFPDLLTAKSH